MRRRIENNWACKENDVGTLPVGVTLHLFITVRLGVVVGGVVVLEEVPVLMFWAYNNLKVKEWWRR